VDRNNQRTIRLRIVQNWTWCEQRLLEEKCKHHTKIYTDGSKKIERVGYSVIWNHKKNRENSTVTKHNLQCLKISHPLHNERTRKKTNCNRFFKYIGCSLGQKGYKKPENPENKETDRTRGRQNNATEALDKNLDKTEEYPPQDLANLIN
jgi:hypothetical protein